MSETQINYSMYVKIFCARYLQNKYKIKMLTYENEKTLQKPSNIILIRKIFTASDAKKR